MNSPFSEDGRRVRLSNINSNCDTIFCQVPLESVCLIDKYSWLELDKTLGEQLLSRLAKNLTVPLVVIR